MWIGAAAVPFKGGAPSPMTGIDMTMSFDGDAFVERFNTVWNGHDIDGILAQMTDDVVFEASFGKDPWGTRITGKSSVRQFLTEMFERIPDIRWDETRRFARPECVVVEWLRTARVQWAAASSSAGTRPRWIETR